MEDEKKKFDEEVTSAESEASTEQKKTAEDKAETEQTGTEEKAEEKTYGKPEEKPTPETEQKTENEKNEEVGDTPPVLSEEDRLKEENFRLKTQLEAMKLGFLPDTIEDAVVLAENIVKRDGGDIGKALQAVAKKYPDWKSDVGRDGKSKGGFKVGADGNNKGSDNDERLSRAFGIKKK